MANPLDLVIKNFKGYNGENPLVRLALALDGKKFGSNVKIDDNELDILNKILATNKFWDDHSNNKNAVFFGDRTPNNEIASVFGKYPYDGIEMNFGHSPFLEPGHDPKFERLSKSTRMFRDRYPHNSGITHITPSVFWEDTFRNDPKVIEKCLGDNYNDHDCARAIYDIANENVVSDAFVPYMEDFAKLESDRRKHDIVNDLSRHHWQVSRINEKRPQNFALDFADRAGIDVRTAKNDAIHRIDKQWRDYYQNVLLKNAEEDGVFLDPISFVNHPVYKDIAMKLISGDDVYEVPEIPEYKDKWIRGRYNEPRWPWIVDHVTKSRRKRGYGIHYGYYSPFVDGKGIERKDFEE